jgi:glyceraldehyde 3-phosphate dehydrogenase
MFLQLMVKVCKRNFLRRNHGSIEKLLKLQWKKGVLGFTEDLVVSQDFVGDSRTSIVDANAELDWTLLSLKSSLGMIMNMIL